jgi:PEP-CTERM motif
MHKRFTLKSIHVISAAAIAMGVACLASPTNASTIYTIVNGTVGSETLSGTITTDGIIGQLDNSDILSWNLSLTDGTTTLAISSANGSAAGTNFGALNSDPSTVYETATGIYINPSQGGYLFFQNGPANTGGAQACWLGNNYTCSSGSSTMQVSFNGDLPADFQSKGIENPFEIASAIPEPSTWAMMLLGFAGVGFMAYRRKSKPSLMAA